MKNNTIDLEKELKTITRASKKICATKESARAFLVKHGYVTRTGKLTKRYGG